MNCINSWQACIFDNNKVINVTMLWCPPHLGPCVHKMQYIANWTYRKTPNAHLEVNSFYTKEVRKLKVSETKKCRESQDILLIMWMKEIHCNEIEV